MTKASLKRSSIAAVGFLVLLLASSPISPAVAQGLGHAFYGTVKIDGTDAAAGTVISAHVAGTEYGGCTVTTAGSYALIVQGEIDEGASILFYADGQEADQTFPFHDGWTTELNLTVAAVPVPKYALTITANPAAGGNASDEIGGSPYAAGTEVSIKAVANPGYGFVGWTAPAGVFGDETAEETTFTMPAQVVTVTAHFGVAYDLAMAADPVAGGNAIDVAAKGAYAAGVTVSIRAESASGYGFVNWTADGPVTFQDATAEETTFGMPPQGVTVTAHFGVAHNLTMAADPIGGGTAIDVGGRGAYAAGATVRIRAVANPGYAFGNWTANATVTFGNATAMETTFLMPPQAVTVTALFTEAVPPPEVPTVTTLAATDISSYAATIHMSYTVGYYTSVEVRLACKRPTDPAWFYTSWVSRPAGGNYTEVLSGLVSQTQYQFKAQLRYDSTVIEGAIYQFTTAAGSSTSLTDLLAYFGCFVATAAYGTPTAEQIDVLREFRDVVLLKKTLGSGFVALYYRLSPPVADIVAGNEVVRTLVRELLVDPVVWLIEATGDTWRN